LYRNPDPDEYSDAEPDKDEEVDKLRDHVLQAPPWSVLTVTAVISVVKG